MNVASRRVRIGRAEETKRRQRPKLAFALPETRADLPKDLEHECHRIERHPHQVLADGRSERRPLAAPPQRLDGVGQLRRGRAVETVGPDERFDETAETRGVLVGAIERLRQLRHVLVEGLRVVQETASERQQVLEMERAFLRAGMRGRSDREHRPADHAGFDLGARVDADRAGRVVQRIEVVVLALDVDRIGAASRPDRHVLENLVVEPVPRLGVLGMGPDQQTRLSQPASGALRTALDPLAG